MIPPGRASKHCHLCGRRLWGRSWVYAPDGVRDEQSLVLCQGCHESAPRCDICGLPMGDNHKLLPDGRCICARCSRTAVQDPARAQALFERVACVIVEQLGLGLSVGADFAMVDAQHLQRLATGVQHKLHDNPDEVVGLFVRKGRKRVMYVLLGLPEVEFIHTIAHEWAHAWQGENCPLLQDSLVREGVAEWAAYKVLQALGEGEEALIRKRNELYEEGLETILHLERKRGIGGVRDFCRRSE